MKLTFTITKEIDSSWIAPIEMSDAEYLAAVQEDLIDFLDGASWVIERS